MQPLVPFLRSFAPLLVALALLAPAFAQASGHPTPPHGEGEQTASSNTGQSQGRDEAKQKKPGIPVDDLLVQTMCGRCHAKDERNHMTRISYVRKSPEGWARTIKRMGRLHGLQLTPDAAKSLVRSLANSHGLAREEAKRGLYDSERRVHWSEEHLSEDYQRACTKCHPMGRALLQHRDEEEWQLLRATHVAMFPLASDQMGGGPPRESRTRRFSAAAFGSSSATTSSSSSSRSGTGRRGGNAESSRSSNTRGNAGDRVLEQLAKDQPLFTPAWRSWARNRREVPLAGTWTVTGHETGRGDVTGTVELTRTGEDEYATVWHLRWTDGGTAERTGKGILYAGYSWRGRTTDASQPPDERGHSLREVLLLSDDWQQFEGRVFTGDYDELGMDVTLFRDSSTPRLVTALDTAIERGRSGHVLTVVANGELPAELAAADFHLGEGLAITSVEHVDARRARLTLDCAAEAKLGTVLLQYGDHPGGVELFLYDTVDYVRVRPLQGLARVGGSKHPKQYERFEAFAVHRGADEKPFTDDDVDLFQVRGQWALEEFRVRDDDDDVHFVGTIDPATGVFTPNADGPNPDRKWQANNVGDVFVTFACELDVPVRPDQAKQQRQEDEQPQRERKTFRARTHLLVTVPIYARWQVLDWEDR